MTEKNARLILIVFGSLVVLVLLGPYFGLNILSHPAENPSLPTAHKRSDPVLEELGLHEHTALEGADDSADLAHAQRGASVPSRSSSREDLDEVEQLLRR